VKFTIHRLAVALCICLLAGAGFAAGGAAGDGGISQPLPQRLIVPAPTPAFATATAATTRLNAASTRLGVDPDLAPVAPPVGKSTALAGVVTTTFPDVPASSPASRPATDPAPVSAPSG
jgi:cation transporter-like permease